MAIATAGLAPRERAELVNRLRARHWAIDFEALYAEGRALPTTESVRLGAGGGRAPYRRAPHRLRPREMPVPQAESRPRLRVLALGPLQVFVGDRLIESTAWGSARPRELLVYLLMHPEGRTKEQVGLAFWPEASASQLRNNFHVTLHRLRAHSAAPNGFC